MVMEFGVWIYFLLVWTMTWKAIGSWKAARNGHLIWFLAIFIINTVGILPIIYIFFFQRLTFSRKSVKKRIKKSKKFPSLF